MLLRLKLGRCVSMSSAKAMERLETARKGVNHAKNMMVQSWLANQRASGLDRLWWPTGDKNAEELGGMSAYRVGCIASPHVNSNHISNAANEVRALLKTKTAYDGEARREGCGYHWQAIVQCIESVPFYRTRGFAVSRDTFAMAWEGRICGKGRKSLAQESVDRSQFLFALSVNSRVYELRTLVWQMEIGKLPPATKDVLRRVMMDDDPLSIQDSSVVQDRKGDWYLHLVYKDASATKPEKGDAVAMVVPNTADQRSAFVFVTPDGRRRYIGPGVAVQRAHGELVSLRRWLAMQPAKGHGKKHQQKNKKAVTRRKRYLEDRVRKQLIADIVKAAKDSGANTILYREPTLGTGVRSREWFAGNGINWDWTKLQTDLSAKCTTPSVNMYLDVKRINTAEFREFHDM